MRNLIIADRVLDLGGDHVSFRLDGVSFIGVQAIPEGYQSTTATLEVKVGMTDQLVNAAPFTVAATVDAASKVPTTQIDVRDVLYGFVEVTATDAGKTARVMVLASDE